MVLHVKPVDQAGQARVGKGVHAPVQQVHQIPGAHGREPHLQRVLQRTILVFAVQMMSAPRSCRHV